MKQELEIIIKGDVVQVTKSINELETEFKELEKQLKTKTGQAFIDANEELDKLRQTIDKVKNIGRTGFDKFGDSTEKAGKGLKNLGKSAQTAAPALASMGQVARDLPFGFIAIQNNLPIMIDSFKDLIGTSKGVVPALKNLGAAMAGPAGITFAIGAIIALTTGLIAKYGSLGNALVALTADSSEAAVKQRELNAAMDSAALSAATETTKLGFLVQEIVGGQGASNARINAYKELKRQYPGILHGMSQENAFTAAGGQLIAKRAAQMIEYIKLKGKEQALVELVAKAAKEELEAGRALVDNVTGKVTWGRRFLNFLQGMGNEQLGAALSANKFAKEVDKAGKSIDFYGQQLAETRIELGKFDPQLIQFEDPAVAAAKLQAAQDKIQAAKDKKERERLAAEAKQLATAKGLAAEQVAGLEKQLAAVNKLANAWLELAIITLQAKANMALIGETDPATIEQIKKNLAAAIKQITDDFNKRKAAFMADSLETPKTISGKTSILLSESASRAVQTMLSNLTLMDKKTTEAASAFETVLAPAIDAAFDALAQGENIIQAVGTAMKRLIISIAATVVKAAILAAILSVISGGSANAAKGGKSFGEFFTGMIKGLAGSKSSFGGAGAGFAGATPSVLTPSFAGFGGGMAIQITGELTGRGTDLVATLDNANARIRRTG